MQRAMQRFKGLKDAIWRVCSIRIAVPLIMANNSYKASSKEYVRNMCEKSVLVLPDDKNSLFRINENVRETVLVEGILKCYNTNEVFVAPVLLPRKKLLYTYEQEKKPRILTLMNPNVEHSLYGNAISSLEKDTSPKSSVKKVKYDSYGELPATATNFEGFAPAPAYPPEGYRSTGVQVRHEAIMENSTTV